MIAYVTMGTNDLPKAVKFYDTLFETIGVGRLMEKDNYFVAWGSGLDKPGFGITLPFNQQAATAGNGTMVAFDIDSKEKVDQFYSKALELGATDEGKPGFRNEGGEQGFYCAYFRDLDGNKFNAFCMVT